MSSEIDTIEKITKDSVYEALTYKKNEQKNIGDDVISYFIKNPDQLARIKEIKELCMDDNEEKTHFKQNIDTLVKNMDYAPQIIDAIYVLKLANMQDIVSESRNSILAAKFSNRGFRNTYGNLN